MYVLFRCWETDASRLVANEMRRDGPNMWQGNDLVAVSFDTFLDRRNSFNFVMNALGGRTDGQVTNERPGFCRTDSLRHSVRCDITRCTRAAAS